MNVEKMRHALERANEAAEQFERARRLAAMTPSHRRKHTGPFGFHVGCAECIASNWRARALA